MEHNRPERLHSHFCVAQATLQFHELMCRMLSGAEGKFVGTGRIVSRKILHPQSVCLVDFQMARYGSPALDLANLLYCCTSLELRQNHMDNLLEHYHTTLIAAMIELERDRCRETVDTTATQPEHLREILSRSIELIRCVCISGPGVFTLELAADGISRIGLREEMHRCGKFGLGLALDMIPISTCDSDQAPDLYVTSRDDVIMSEGEDVLSTPVWTCNELCRQRMTDLVKELVEKGDL
uniref:CHK kinase-like domain-containing protein n=1 Tax=Timema monikensis TaxID=170555 RepID=A0A7R9EAP6_9NEOP|nr:unnamed protein product [Timema monikensis]